MKISFTETDITPPIGVRKIGWIRLNVSDELRDPPYARTCIIQSGDSSIAIIQLDTLSIRWTQVNDIRKRVAEQFGFPGERVMVSATHNHAGPAVCSGVDFEREEGYIEEMVVKIVASFGQALDRLEEAELGIGRGMEFDIAHNRRVMMKDGTTKTHGSFSDPNALCFEGPIDPEVFVLSARNKSGDLLGALVNFACHPTHLGDGGVLSAGWPGVFADEMKLKGCMVPMFINGAAGNIHHNNPGRGGQEMSMEEAGKALADRAWEILGDSESRSEVKLGSRMKTIQLPYREATEDEVKGTVKGAQRFVDPSLYDKAMPKLLERIRTRLTQPADVQVHFIDEIAIAAIPAEFFVELGLRIKEQSHPKHALIAGFSNGMVGYVPHLNAFPRGGYETTFGSGSRLAPEAGDMLADCAVEVIQNGPA